MLASEDLGHGRANSTNMYRQHVPPMHYINESCVPSLFLILEGEKWHRDSLVIAIALAYHVPP